MSVWGADEEKQRVDKILDSTLTLRFEKKKLKGEEREGEREIWIVREGKERENY